jgi:hypothetical protein
MNDAHIILKADNFGLKNTFMVNVNTHFLNSTLTTVTRGVFNRILENTRPSPQARREK